MDNDVLILPLFPLFGEILLGVNITLFTWLPSDAV